MPVRNILKYLTIKSLVDQKVVCYNFTKKRWNTNRHNGCTIKNQKTATDDMNAFKAAMEQIPEFGAQYEIAAALTMTIDREFFHGWGNPVSNPVYSWRGPAVIGNLIVRNQETREYELYCKSWVGVSDYCTRDEAAIYGAHRFAQCGIWTSSFREKLIAAHTK